MSLISQKLISKIVIWQNFENKVKRYRMKVVFLESLQAESLTIVLSKNIFQNINLASLHSSCSSLQWEEFMSIHSTSLRWNSSSWINKRWTAFLCISKRKQSPDSCKQRTTITGYCSMLSSQVEEIWTSTSRTEQTLFSFHGEGLVSQYISKVRRKFTITYRILKNGAWEISNHIMQLL